MENQKNNKTVVILLIIIILILLVLCGLFATNVIELNINKKSKDVTEEKKESPNEEVEETVSDELINYEETYKGFKIFAQDANASTKECFNFNEKQMYDYENNYVDVLKNLEVNGKKYTFGYVVDKTNKTNNIFLNNKEVVNFTSNELLLLDVCIYGKYIVYSQGWEGPSIYTIINTNGDNVFGFRANPDGVSYSNGILNVKEIDYNDPRKTDDSLLRKYKLDMNSKELKKIDETTEPYTCDPNGAGYDCQ